MAEINTETGWFVRVKLEKNNLKLKNKKMEKDESLKTRMAPERVVPFTSISPMMQYEYMTEKDILDDEMMTDLFINMDPDRSFGYVEDGKLTGYIIARLGDDEPLYCSTDSTSAQKLALAMAARDASIKAGRKDMIIFVEKKEMLNSVKKTFPQKIEKIWAKE